MCSTCRGAESCDGCRTRDAEIQRQKGEFFAEIERLKAEAAELKAALYVTKTTRDTIAEETVELREVVHQLPRTADGVPIVPGMNCRTDKLDVGVLSVSNDFDFSIGIRDGGGNEWDVNPEELFAKSG